MIMFNKTLITLALVAASFFSAAGVAAENVDLLIKNATVLTMDADRNVYENGLVAVKENRIFAVSDGSDVDEYEASKVIDAEGGIVMPGMINTHTHVSMAVFRSLADDVPDRLRRYIFPLENKMVSKEMSYLGALHGSIEMAKAGVTTMVDM